MGASCWVVESAPHVQRSTRVKTPGFKRRLSNINLHPYILEDSAGAKFLDIRKLQPEHGVKAVQVDISLTPR